MRFWMVSSLPERVQIDHLWNPSLPFSIDTDGHAVQQKNRLLGHRGSYPLTFHCWQPFQNKKQIRFVKNSYWRFLDGSRITLVAKLHHFYFKKEPNKATGYLDDTKTSVHSKISGLVNFIRIVSVEQMIFVIVYSNTFLEIFYQGLVIWFITSNLYK